MSKLTGSMRTLDNSHLRGLTTGCAEVRRTVQRFRMPKPNTPAWRRCASTSTIAIPRSQWREARRPEAISRDASVLVLSEHGYVTAVEGKSGFVCIVERSWMSPEDSQDFWDPKLRGPICFNPPRGAIHSAGYF